MVDRARNTPEHFEELGPDRVRFLLSRQGLDEKFSMSAIEWLAEYDRKEKTKQDDVAQSSKRAAWLAAWLAFAAVLVSLGAWYFPKSDTKPSPSIPQAQNVGKTEPAKSNSHANLAK